jgi:ABC-type oligopeptide transport system ATPase subunit/L-aminopeptidase/D-esterase-like protein
MTSTEILGLERVSITYRSGPFWKRRVVAAVRDVSVTIREGEILGLVGESGSGKTTIGRLCLGLSRPESGSVLFRRHPFPADRRSLKGQVAIVLQHPEWALNPRLTIGRSIAEPLVILGSAAAEQQDRVDQALVQVGLEPAIAGRYPHELSGGQRQRVAIARALITNPDFVVFDEAVSALDVSVQTQVLNLIKNLQQQRKFCALFISHDLAATRYVADRIAVMRHGEIVEVGPVSRFYGRPEAAYSRQLWDALPKTDNREKPMTTTSSPFEGFAARTPDRRFISFDFPGVTIGTKEYESGPTGCTVLRFDRAVACVSDVRGGSPGFLGGYAVADAICFAGGSLYGLEAASGVASAILEQRGVAKWGQIACVQSAIIFDLGARDTLEYPDKAIGTAAWRAASAGGCWIGQAGAGRLATVGKLYAHPRYRPELGGQGAAFREVAGVKILVVTVVNALGVVVDRAGNVVRGLVDVETGLRAHPRDVLDPGRNLASASPAAAGGNTTVTAVVINRKIERAVLVQLARQVHASMARAIQPFHTIRDGDVLFALSTEEVAADSLEDFALAEIASDLAWDAVLSAVGTTG